MKRTLLVCLVLTAVLVCGMALAQQAATSAPSLTVSRMEIAGSVENRQPVGIAATFPASTEKVYCYIELKDVPQDTTITYVWMLGPNEMAKVTQDAMEDLGEQNPGRHEGRLESGPRGCFRRGAQVGDIQGGVASLQKVEPSSW